jgi:ABC-type multidrug transport system fused ATPase/permease subunit
MGLLDLIGVICIGALGALSVQGLESRPAGNRVSVILRFFGISHNSLQFQVTVLGFTAGVILIFKTFASVIFSRRIFFFLSNRGARVSANLISKLLGQNLLTIQKRTSQETLYIVTEGVNNLRLGILATTIQIISDCSLLIIMIAGLIVVDPVTAISTVALFSVVGVSLHRLLRVRARELGKSTFKLSVENNEQILEVLNSYRETVVRNRQQYYSENISKLRYRMANVIAENSFMPYISKYVIESTTVFAALILSSYEFMTHNAVHALSTMAVFLTASSRIAPAALRVQQGILTVRNNSGSASETFALISEFVGERIPEKSSTKVDFSYKDFEPKLEVQEMTFSYPGATGFAVHNVNLKIPAGSSAAIVGPSGAGKSTLVDLILGVLKPSSGLIEISHMASTNALKRWPGAISYVPQNIVISNGTIRDNVRLGYPAEFATDDRVRKALEIAQILPDVKGMAQGLDSLVGEGGSKLSGGQRQRLGIARALFTNPLFLVLDEATSSLDGQTEAELSSAITSLKGSATVVIVAHRLSTIRKVDQVIYMDKGTVLAIGTFEEIRSRIPDFDTQAGLMGL